jgi:hypothetical protein
VKRALVVVALALGGAFACVATDDRVVVTPPDRATFPAVSDVMARHCGSLDCHGTTGRNLRVYGSLGLRLAQTGDDSRPTSAPHKTTIAEYDEDYLSLLGLEPEVMSAVVADKGQSPERLTFVRKARGHENHKGGTVWPEGSDLDRCFLTWLAGQAACPDETAKSP